LGRRISYSGLESNTQQVKTVTFPGFKPAFIELRE